MRYLTFYMAFAITIGFVNAQEQYTPIVEGEILVLSQPLSSSYHYIEFPRPNIILKRGAIANFNNLIGRKVIVERVITNEDGSKKAILKRKDGQNFFRFFPSVKANLDKALAKGELKPLKSENAITQQ